MEYRPVRVSASLRLDAGELDYLGPFLDFVHNEPTKFGGRHRHWNGAQIRKLCLHLGVGEPRVDLLVELFNDLVRRVPGGADPLPASSLISGQKISHSRNVR